MKKIIDKGADLFDKLVLGHPILTIIIFLVFIAFFPITHKISG